MSIEDDDLDTTNEDTEEVKEKVEETEFFFVLDYERFPVRIQDPETKEISEFELRELPGNHRDTFMNKMRTKVDSHGNVKDFIDVQASLLAMVMFRVGETTPLKIEAIRKFPAKMLDKLYTKAVKMNALGKEAELQAKKS